MTKQRFPKIPSSVKKGLRLSFRKEKLLASAIFHPSYRNENEKMRLYDFDRLEFFGDAILNYVICKKLYQVFPQSDEGTLSRLRSTLVSRKILARIAKDMKLHTVVHLGRGLASQPLDHKNKLLADCFEALLAAIYMDRGMPAARNFILKHFKHYFNARRIIRLDPNPKSSLQELSQKHWRKLPTYRHQSTKKGIKTVVSVTTRRKATAIARTRQASEEKAARELIQKIRQEIASRSKKKSSGKSSRKTR